MTTLTHFGNLESTCTCVISTQNVNPIWTRNTFFKSPFKDALSGLRQLLVTSKMIKNTLYFTFKPLFVFKVFTFLSWPFVHVGKRLDEKEKIIFKIYDVATWETNHCNTHIIHITHFIYIYIHTYINNISVYLSLYLHIYIYIYIYIYFIHNFNSTLNTLVLENLESTFDLSCEYESFLQWNTKFSLQKVLGFLNFGSSPNCLVFRRLRDIFDLSFVWV